MKIKKIIISNKKMVKLLTILIYVISICIYELGICNGKEIKNYIENGCLIYNFSFPRLVLYIIFLIFLTKFIKKNIDDVLKSLNTKTKKIILGIYIPTSIIIITYVLLKWTSIYKVMTIAITLLMGFIFIIYISSNYIKNIIVTTFTLGIVFTFATDFHHSIDEKKHMMSAINLANGNFNYTENPLNEPVYNNIIFNCDIDSFVQFFSQRYESGLTGEWNRTEETEIYYLSSSPADYNFILYIPSATGILFAKLLGGSVADIYIIGRIFNLITYALLLIIIMKLLPYKKKIFYIIFMLPFTVLIAASYSIDGICIGLLGIFIAYCLNLCERKYETIKLKQIITLIVLFLLCMLAKNLAYFSILIFIFVLPIFKILKNNKKSLPILISIILIISVIGMIFLINKLNVANSEGGDPRGGTTSVKGQIEFLVNSPINILKVGLTHMGNSILNYNWYTDLNHSGFFGEYSSQIFLLEFFFIIYVIITDNEKIVNKRINLVSIVTFLAVFITTSFMLYLTFTPVGEINLLGYQPRYITPILPIILMLLNDKRFISKSSDEKQKNIDLNICLILGFFTFIDLLCLTHIV